MGVTPFYPHIMTKGMKVQWRIQMEMLQQCTQVEVEYKAVC